MAAMLLLLMVGIKKVRKWVAFNGIVFICSFMRTRSLVQKLLGEGADTQTLTP
jgi:hypothetical protein